MPIHGGGFAITFEGNTVKMEAITSLISMAPSLSRSTHLPGGACAPHVQSLKFSPAACATHEQLQEKMHSPWTDLPQAEEVSAPPPTGQQRMQ